MIRIAMDVLEGLASNLKTMTSVLDAAVDGSATGTATGHDGVDAQVGDFIRVWQSSRETNMDGINTLGALMTCTVEGFRDLDEHYLATQS